MGEQYFQESYMTDTQGTPDDLIAAVDLGSNSFHMVIAQEFQGEIRTIEKRGQKVQLGAGLDSAGILSEEAQQRGIDCLREFGKKEKGNAKENRQRKRMTKISEKKRPKSQKQERMDDIKGNIINQKKKEDNR